jgi:glycerol kinase
MSKPFLLGIDQGTSGSRALIIDKAGAVRGYAHIPLERLYPKPDRVEQDPLAVAAGVAEAITLALADANARPNEIAACGIACQRNSDFVWDARTGLPLANTITWQDLRTLPLLAEIEQLPFSAELGNRLGYPVAPYMSALHLAWRMRHDTAVREAAKAGTLRIGQSALWLVQQLGQPAAYAMDHSLVQATGLFDIRAGAYWPEWLDWVGLSAESLPEPKPTIFEYGSIGISGQDGSSAVIPVLAMIGDQQAALFGQGCRQPGALESTHGTASYVKMFAGENKPSVEMVDVLCAWDIGDGQTYCLEAQTTVTGAAIRWMRDELGLFATYDEIETLAESVPDSGDVMFVPAFTGLNVPYNDRHARAALFGMTLGTRRGHIMRAFLDALGLQMRAIMDTMRAATGLANDELLVGGGVSASDLACQIQADLTGLRVRRPVFRETTAFAGALLAGLGADIWDSAESLPIVPGEADIFEPQLDPKQRIAQFDRWQEAVALTRRWRNQPPTINH